ncbi:hypothetical protein JTB14_012495 [Gonioctena quinquepunctata]|nr:hypothetical protein JTB14_012495 [Gonioctena quinquepunctata]
MKTANCEQSQATSVVNVNISDLILTPLTCASLVNEVLKGLLYQKSQIPYPYSWMKTVLEKKRHESENEQSSRQINFSAANHHRIVSTAYELLESVMQGIIREFRDSVSTIEEVVIIFGTTPHSPKEIFTINVSSLAKGHFERNHISELNKSQPKILRDIFLSQTWLDSIDTSLTCTNTYIYLKKDITNISNECSTQSVFVPIRPLTFSPKVKNVRLNLCSDKQRDQENCCENLSIFADDSENKKEKQQQSSSSEVGQKNIVWYQFKDLIKGFKDCYINKESASELW